MLLYASTVFVSAFLLFLVQPIVAKLILPWFGGSAAVWTTCLVFFQTALLAGYAYCDLVTRHIGPRGQVRLHMALLVASLAVLPILPGSQWKPNGSEEPSTLILLLLVATIGPPYFLLSTTSPLLQAWFARANAGSSPYRLFALSNFASLLALAGYPFLLEPWAPTRIQAIGWSAGYAAFVALCVVTGWRSLRAPLFNTSPVGAQPDRGRDEDAPPTMTRQVLWSALAATGSLLLLAVTNHITQNVAAMPLLWIAPLALYLLTFILCFDSVGWYRRALFLPMAAAGLGVMAWILADPEFTYELWINLGVFCAGLFLACMFCHGELARSKPAPKYLTRYYLMVSVGGAVGSVLVGIIAPLALPAYFELAGGLVACAGLLLWQVRREAIAYRAVALAALAAAIGCGAWGGVEFYDGTRFATRNFYGVLRVQEEEAGTPRARRSLIHGSIRHGSQYLAPDLRQLATTYYSTNSGIGRLIEWMHARGKPLRVGIIGLGAGTLAAYGTASDVYRFYEINPAVIAVARREFTFLADSEAKLEWALGDARLILERETPQRFDVLVVDAFSGDAIPVHLITSEAVDIYRRHLAPGGVIAYHVTNRYLDLVPVVEALAKAQELRVIRIADDGSQMGASGSDWLLLSEDAGLLAAPELAGYATPFVPHGDMGLWTDDFNNLVQVLK
jgi:SAM-dependent methyltransferase